jgi:hypothetical protein
LTVPRRGRRLTAAAAIPFILLLALTVPAGASNPEFVVNGTFDTNLSGWTVSTSGCTNPGWMADGNPGGSAWLNACGEVGSDPSIAQTLTGLTSGETYTLRGDYRSVASSFGNPAKPDAFEVELDGTVILSLGRPSPTATTWTAFSVQFTATATSHTIAFYAERDGDDSDFAVDNISVMSDEPSVPTPTPLETAPPATEAPSGTATPAPTPTQQVTAPPTDLAPGSAGPGGSASPIVGMLILISSLAVAATLLRRPRGRPTR